MDGPGKGVPVGVVQSRLVVLVSVDGPGRSVPVGVVGRGLVVPVPVDGPGRGVPVGRRLVMIYIISCRMVHRKLFLYLLCLVSLVQANHGGIKGTLPNDLKYYGEDPEEIAAMETDSQDFEFEEGDSTKKVRSVANHTHT